MQLSEQELRDMIRDAIARHAAGQPTVTLPAEPSRTMAHASHGMFALVATSDGQCIIEPAVACNHCGYCKSLGH